MKNNSLLLKISNLSKSFNNTRVLNQVELEMEHASAVGLAGASGGGKSTLLRLIQKLEIPDSGTIELHAKVGFMFQDFQLFPHMTVLQNVIYSPRLHRLHNKNYMKEAIAMLESLGMASKMQNYPCHLSGGQKQRTALARSLMMHPDILLCDEPTSGLDAETRQDVVTLLQAVKNRGVSMLIASHDLDFLSKITDRILLLDHGSIRNH